MRRNVVPLVCALIASAASSYGQGLPATIVCDTTRSKVGTVDLYATVAIQAVIAKVPCGERVSLIDRVSGWALVVTQAGKHGYIDQQYIGPASGSAAAPTTPIPTATSTSAATANPAPQAPLNAPPAQQTLRNDSIVRLVQAGLSEDTILTVISNQPGEYSTSANDLVALKTAGVSEKVIAGMMGKGPKTITEPTASSPPAKDVSSDVDVQSFRENHGLYYQEPDKLVPIEGQAISFSRTGSLLSSAVTLGIRSKKQNVQMLGHTSGHVTGSEPVFYYRAAAGTEAAGGSAGDLVLVKMTSHGDRRQLEMEAQGYARASKGISIRAQIQLVRKQVEPDLYRLSPAQKLEQGEYAFYLFRGYDLPGFLYDFTVE